MPKRWSMGCGLLLGICSALTYADDHLEQALRNTAQDINPTVLHLAMQAVSCAGQQGFADATRLAVIDYSRPSLEPRLWVFDLAKQQLLFHELVAHGRNSGENIAQYFSNEDGSNASSLGLFRTLETYNGHNGYSLRLEGLDYGFNDHARARSIVMHGADYVSPIVGQKLGHLGRSLGCPALTREVAPQVIDTLKEGQWLFAYYPDPQWLNNSTYLNCQHTTTHVAQTTSTDNSNLY